MALYTKTAGAWERVADGNRLYVKSAGAWQRIGYSFSDPLDIANLAIWLDMSDTSTITAPGGVRTITDKSGNGRTFAAPSSAASPASGTRTINGKNVLDFDGSDDYLVGPTTPVASAETGVRWTVFMVHSDDNATDGKSLLSQNFSSTIGQRRFQMFQSTSAGNPNQVVVKGGTAVTLRAAHTAQPQVSAIRWNGTALALKNTATGDGSVASGSGSVGSYSDAAEVGSKWKVGARTNGTTVDTVTGWHDGAVAEVIVYDRDLTDSEVDLVLNYLRSKWGIL